MQRDVRTADTEHYDPAHWRRMMQAVAGQRDRASFLSIYDYFMPRVQRYLMNLGATQPLAEDLAQEALLRVWQRADSYNPAQASLSTWLFRIARNLHIDRLRREPWWVPVQQGLERLEQRTQTAPTTETYTEIAALQVRLEQLPANQARMLRMSYFEGKTHREIAAELQLPLGTVKSGLRRAFLRLQVHMKSKS